MTGGDRRAQRRKLILSLPLCRRSFNAVDLIKEAMASFHEETRLCASLLEESVAVSAGPGGGVVDRERQLLYIATWSNRPFVHEHRLRSLQEALRIELDR